MWWKKIQNGTSEPITERYRDSKMASQSKPKLVPKKTGLNQTLTNGKRKVKEHQCNCRICNHPQRELIEEILNWPQISIKEFAKKFGFNLYTVKSAIIRHSKAMGLELEKIKIAEWANYFLLFDLESDKATINNKLTFNDQQQKIEGRYKEAAQPQNVQAVQNFMKIINPPGLPSGLPNAPTKQDMGQIEEDEKWIEEHDEMEKDALAKREGEG